MISGGGGIRALPGWQEWSLAVTAKKLNQKTKVRHHEKGEKEEETVRAKYIQRKHCENGSVNESVSWNERTIQRAELCQV